MKKLNLTMAIMLSVCLLMTGVFAQKMKKMDKKSPSSDFKLKPLNIEQYKLDNGLRVVLNEDSSIPVVTVAVYYDVGSRDEKKGRTGFAHLFEHMMFQGSENIGKAEHFQYVNKSGGTMNGTTSSERTNYFETLPANQLPMGIWLESDRMRSLNVTEENLVNQRNAVQEEKRRGVDNQPYGNVINVLNDMIYKNFANSHSTIGSMADLDAATVKDVKEFFTTYYAPNNAVLVISGAFDSKEAKGLVSKYFSTIPKQSAPPKTDVAEPVEVVEKYKTYEDKLAPLPAFLIGYKIPARGTTDFNSLELAGKLLYDGNSSRLYQKLVKGDESVIQLFAGTDERRGPSSIFIGALPKPGKDVKEIRQAMFDEIKNMAKNGPTMEEMSKLRNQLLNDEVSTRQSSLSRAMTLAEFTLYDGNPNLMNTHTENLLKITPEQIKKAVDSYLNTENRALLDVVPAGQK